MPEVLLGPDGRRSRSGGRESGRQRYRTGCRPIPAVRLDELIDHPSRGRTNPITTTSDETRSPAIEEQGARKVSRRSVLTWIGVGAGTAALVAGTGIGVRATSNGAFTAGLGTPDGLWQDWGAVSGVERMVAAGVQRG